MKNRIRKGSSVSWMFKLSISTAALAALLVLGAACGGGQVTTQDLEGVLQAVDGKQAVISLDDGSKVRIEIEKSTDDVKTMVGDNVQVKVKTGEDNPKAIEVQKLPAGAASAAIAVPGIQVVPEDLKFSGVLQSKSANSIVIGGKTFQVNAATVLDQGLAAGVQANVEYITLSDGSLLATEIETPANDDVTMEGRLQGVDDRRAIISLDDGSKMEVEVETEKSIDDVKALIGEDVQVKIESGDDNPKIVEMQKAPAQQPGIQVVPEDLHFSGTLQSKTANSVVVGGKTFQVNAATMLDQGLAVGVEANVEFIMLSGGAMLATNIETPADDDIVLVPGGPEVGQVAENFSVSGTIQSLTAGEIVIGNKTYKINAGTMLDTGLQLGVLARVEFVPQADGSFLALEVETDAPQVGMEALEDFSASGPIQSMQPGLIVVDGRSFKTDAATILDSGLAVGVLAKVEFILLADGTMLAKEVETAGIDEGENLYFAGPVQSMGAGAFVIGGKTFKVDSATGLDQGLAVGVMVNVEFVVQPDGTLRAVEIEDTGIEFSGILQAVSPNAYTIGGRVFMVNAATEIDAGLKVRKLARVNFKMQPDGTLLALSIETAKGKLPQGFSLKGVVQSVSGVSLVVSGSTFQINTVTTVGAGVVAGNEVIVRFDVKPGGVLVALSVERAAAAKN